MPLPATSKDKSARLDWGYHARRSGFARVRRWLWLLAALVALPLVGLTVFAAVTDRVPPPLAAVASRGPLTHAHSRWDTDCETCHTPFQSINSAGWLDRLTGRPKQSASGNLRCEGCHVATAHHPAQKADEVAGCADCHRDHQGREHDLKRLADASCTRCHADLSAHHASTPQVATVVRGFSTGHPEFRNNPTDDPGPFRRTLRFAHAAHLTASPMMAGYLAQMSEADQARYAPMVEAMRAGNTAAVCGSCHQFDRARLAGAAPVPITYETHCQACHPLTFDSADGLKAIAAPHRVAPDALERFLRQTYTERFVSMGLTGGTPPNRGAGRLDPPLETIESTRGQIAERVTGAMALLAGGGGCGKCHTPNGSGGYHLTNIPVSWQPRARFDHAAHRMMACQQCHPRAFDQDQPAPLRPPDLPTIQNCQSCHSPAGGVSHGCTDCHSYHQSDRRPKSHAAAKPLVR